MAPWGQSATGSPWQSIQDALSLLNTRVSDWVVELDGFKAVDGSGVSHAWLNDVLGVLSIRVPWRLMFSTAVEPFLKKLLHGVLGG